MKLLVLWILCHPVTHAMSYLRCMWLVHQQALREGSELSLREIVIVGDLMVLFLHHMGFTSGDGNLYKDNIQSMRGDRAPFFHGRPLNETLNWVISAAGLCFIGPALLAFNLIKAVSLLGVPGDGTVETIARQAVHRYRTEIRPPTT